MGKDYTTGKLALGRAFMTIAELAHYLGVSVNTIYEWNSVGSGPAYYRVGRYVRYKKEDVEAWLEGRRVPSAQAS